MAPSGNEILDQLDAGERGFVLGALLLQSSADSDPSAALESPSDVRCREALARIAALSRSARVKLTQHLAREVVSPIPAGIEDVDESVLAALLRDEAPEILRLVAATAPRSLRQAIAARVTEEPPLESPPAEPTSPQNSSTGATKPVSFPASPDDAEATRPVAAASLEGDRRQSAPDATSPELVIELHRVLFSRIVPVHPSSEPLAPPARELLLLDPARRTAELSRLGAGVLGQSLRGARREVVLRAAAVAGPPWAAQILAAAGSPPDPATSEGDPEMDRTAALELVAAMAPATASGETVARLGARTTGARMTREGKRGLSGADQARALAQRLPPAIGGEVLSGAGVGPDIL